MSRAAPDNLFPPLPEGVRAHAIPPGPRFLPACARHVLDAVASAVPGLLPDLSSVVVVLPNQHIAPAFRRALGQAHGAPLWMPQLFTLTGLAAGPLAKIQKDSDCARQMRLFEVLRAQPLFKSHGHSVWQIAAELAALFDALTERAAPLPPDAEGLEAALVDGYDTAPCEALSFEARLVHTLWQADAEGTPSLARALQQALAEVAAEIPADRPFFLMCDGRLSATEQRFVEAVSRRTDVHVFAPARDSSDDALLDVLAAAWPAGVDAPPIERALRLRERHPESPLASRVQFIAAHSLEQEANHAARCIRGALESGAKSVALIAADRVAARRARAALSAHGIEAVDETGWLLSTTRAAAFIDAVLELVSSQGYHRAVLDLARTPFACADWPSAEKTEALLMLERVIARRNLVSGLAGLERVLSRDEATAGALRLVSCLQAASQALAGGSASVAGWLTRLAAAIDALGARAALAADAAGAEVLALLDARGSELAGHGVRLDFAEWRDWLNREFERAMFRDERIVSEVALTHLAAARLRQFDLAVVVGADREHLAPAVEHAVFANEGVRRELNLAGKREARERLREDLVLLASGARELVFTRQAWKRDEHNLPSPELELLDMVHELAWGTRLTHSPIEEPVRGAPGGLQPLPAPAPVVGVPHLPGRLSASGYGALVACPYQYFARHVLRLAEQDEVSEALAKHDYGEVVHGVLNGFHADHPKLLEHDEAVLIERLAALTAEAFQSACEDNFMEHAWRLRWALRLPAYLAWARQREAAGWLWAAGERPLDNTLTLPDGGALTLHGRIDRIDQRAGEIALLDYKTQPLSTLRKKVEDPDSDVQLAFYTLLQGSAVKEAAYVALDDEAVGEAGLADVEASAALHGQRIVQMFGQLREGAPLPAHGVPAVCSYCEMQGVCRKPHHAEGPQPSP